jgi:hypothetical protein
LKFIYYIRLCALNLRRLVCRMTSFQFTTMSIPTAEKDQTFCTRRLLRLWYAPFTRGGKLGLEKALKSFDEAFETLFPRKIV